MNDSTSAKTCIQCHQEKPIYEYGLHKGFKDGHHSTCKKCTAEKYGWRYVPGAPDGYKYCSSCEQVKPATSEYFKPGKRYKDNLQATCRECRNVEQQVSRRNNGVQPKKDTSIRDGKKTCTKCRIEYPATVEHFNRHSTNSVGLMAMCKACYNAYATPKALAYRDRDIEAHKIRVKRYNPKAVIKALRRRTLKASLPHQFEMSDWNRCLEWWGSQCAYCGQPEGQSRKAKLCADHYIPITSTDCPGTVIKNIIPACMSCNSSKSDHSPLSWLIKKFNADHATWVIQRISIYFQYI